MRRDTEVFNVNISAVEATCTSISYMNCAGGCLYVPANTFTTLTWYVSTTGAAGSFIALVNRSNTAVTQTVGTGATAVPIPDECFGAPYIKAVAAGGTLLAVAVSVKT